MHEAGRGFLDAADSYKKGDFSRVFQDGASIIKTFTRTQETRDEIRKTRTSPADVIQLSGCKNYQTSADAVEGVTLTHEDKKFD
jgi:metacaspase-1